MVTKYLTYRQGRRFLDYMALSEGIGLWQWRGCRVSVPSSAFGCCTALHMPGRGPEHYGSWCAGDLDIVEKHIILFIKESRTDKADPGIRSNEAADIMAGA